MAPPNSPPKGAGNAQAGNRNLLQNIIFGGVAGVIGQSCVFPLYTIKTRLQLYPERHPTFAQCARSILRQGGLRAFYKGLPPAVTGVFPEKAIKLSVNDYLTAVLSRPDGSISVPMAMLAGGTAGLCQVVITNPMELTMINMQAAAARGDSARNMFKMARDLGLQGLYKGTQATLFRDIPFSMVFFSMNTTLRAKLTDDQGKLPMSKVFLAGIASGSTAATLSTPMDVIKTRLQATASSSSPSSSTPTPPPTAKHAAQQHAAAAPTPPKHAPFSRLLSTAATSSSVANAAQQQPKYTGIMHCARHIYATEGMAGFFAGTLPRVLIISPLFGITLFFYDIQRRLQASGRI